MNWAPFAFLFPLLTLRLLGIESQPLWGNPVNGYSVGLSFSNPVASLEQPLLATVYVRNDSQTEQWLTVSPVEVLTSFVGSDEFRKQLELRPPPDMENIIGFKGVPLLPGQVWSNTVNVHDFLILTNPGEFVVTAWRVVGRDIVAFSENHLLRLTGEKAPVPLENHGVPSKSGSPSSTNILKQIIKPTNELSKPETVVLRGSVPVISPNATAATHSAVNQGKPAQKVATGIVVGLLAILLAVFWRAARRKRP